MSDVIISALDTAYRIEDSGISYFSNLSRKFHRFSELKNTFEIYAKTKISNKKFFSDLSVTVKKNGIKINQSKSGEINLAGFGKIIEDTEAVGDHSLPDDVLKTAFGYLRDTNRLYSTIRDTIGFDNTFNKIIDENKFVLDLVKQHVHKFNQEVRFYGYE